MMFEATIMLEATILALEKSCELLRSIDDKSEIHDALLLMHTSVSCLRTLKQLLSKEGEIRWSTN